METIWLIKLIFSHLLTDFVFQTKKWITDRNSKHSKSVFLYIHTLLTAGLAWTLIGWQYWNIAIVIFTTHTFIDIWKSYKPQQAQYFLIDQFLHLLVIFVCWWFTFYSWDDIGINWQDIQSNQNLWITITAFLFLTSPTSILIGQLTKKWRKDLANSDALEDAGKWIGIIERTMILILVLQNQYEAIGLLIAAKSVIRFNENNRTEQKTEYLLIGTLISISIAVITGLIVQSLFVM